jgi:hypothetical protein
VLFILESIDAPGDVREKVSWGIASGGDIRLFWMARSILSDRLIPKLIVFFEVDGNVGEKVNGWVNE